MRNRINCSAESLTQLEPDMVHSVVGGQVYKLGNQYYQDNRVRVLESDSGQISAEVNGTFGVYTQNIKLRGGTLATKCSCPSSEQPFCRHCVAVLLQHFYNQTPQTESAGPSESAETMASQKARSSNPSPSSGDFNFREVTDFVDWIQIAIENLGKSPQLPPLPSFGQGSVRTWAEAIEIFHQQFLQVEKDRNRTQSDLQLAQGKIDNLTQDLEQSSLEAKDAQGACVGLQKEIEKYKELLENLAAVTKERDLLNEQLRVAKGDLDKNCAELDSLSLTLKNISKSILGALPPFP